MAEDDEVLTRTYEGDGYIVAVTYQSDANIPEEAELIVEQVTQPFSWVSSGRSASPSTWKVI